MDFNQFVEGNLLTIRGICTKTTGELISFLQSNTYITSLNLSECEIGNEGAKELAKFTNLTSLHLSRCGMALLHRTLYW